MYIVHCTLCIVHCTLYIVHCTLCIVHRTLYIVHCTLYIVHCTLYIVHCALYIVPCTPPQAACDIMLGEALTSKDELQALANAAGLDYMIAIETYFKL